MTEVKISQLMEKVLKGNKGAWLWNSIGEKKIISNSSINVKAGGAKGDLCFAKRGGTFLIVENKLKKARFQPRQQLLYINHFLALYLKNPGLNFRRHRLLVLVPKGMKKKYQKILSLKSFEPNNIKVIKSGLTTAEIISRKKTANWTKYTVRGVYKGLKRRFTIRVRLVEIDVKELIFNLKDKI